MLVPRILLGGRRAVCDLANSIDDADLEKSLGGPFIGPNGGMWADAQHTIHWQPNDPHGAAAIHAKHPTLFTTQAHEIYKKAGGTLTRQEWRPHYLAAVAAAQAAGTTPAVPVATSPHTATLIGAPIQHTDVANIPAGKGKVVVATFKNGTTKPVELGMAGGVRTTGLSEAEFMALATWQGVQAGKPAPLAMAKAAMDWAHYGGAATATPVPATSSPAPASVSFPTLPAGKVVTDVPAHVAAVAAAVSASTGIPVDKIKAAFSGSAAPATGHGKVRRAVIDAILTGGHAVQNALLHVPKDPAKSSATAVSLATSNSDKARIAKEYAHTPVSDLQILSAIEARNTPISGQAVCKIGPRSVHMGVDCNAGDFRHELGHAVYAIHNDHAGTKGGAWDQAVKQHWAAARAKAAVTKPPPGATHEWYETNLGVIGKRCLDTEHEDAAEHYRGYHKAIYQDQNEGGGGSALTAYRTRHPAWAALWDAHYTAALLGVHL